MTILRRLLVLSFGLCATAQAEDLLPSVARLKFACLNAMRLATSRPKLPDRLEIGAENIHRFPNGNVVTIFAAIPPAGAPARLFDTNTKRFEDPYPRRFAMADGGRDRVILGVDASPGTPLHACLMALATPLRFQKSHPSFRAHVLELVSALMDLVPPEGMPWDRGVLKASESGALDELFREALPTRVGGFPITKPGRAIERSVVPLEDYLRNGRGYCVQKAIFAALLLEKVGIPSRVLNGASETSGHTWVELADGTWLDPTWGILGVPSTEGALPGWKRHGSSFVYVSQLFPYLAYD